MYHVNKKQPRMKESPAQRNAVYERMCNTIDHLHNEAEQYRSVIVDQAVTICALVRDLDRSARKRATH